MPQHLGALALLAVVGLVIARALVLRGQGIRAMHFGRTDRSDFLIPPFALFYIYLVLAAAFGWPVPARPLFASPLAAWLGVGLCAAALALFAWTIVSFGRSFRVGIDAAAPDALVTTGAFAVSRNPIYVAFGLLLIGETLIWPIWIMVAYLVAGVLVVHRQVLREEGYLNAHYGPAYADYRRRVRRYL